MSDLISRQAAISAICNACGKIDCDKMDKCEKLQLPPANCSEFPNNSDTISRQAAIDAPVKMVSEGLDWIPVYHIKGLPSAQPERKKGRWIPCSERLPEEGERVLATHLGGLNPNRQVIEHIYQNGVFTCGWEMDTDFHSPTFGQRYMGKVIAWMPLPEAYREDES